MNGNENLTDATDWTPEEIDMDYWDNPDPRDDADTAEALASYARLFSTDLIEDTTAATGSESTSAITAHLKAAEKSLQMLEVVLVARLRARGTTWAEIGDGFGITRQAAQQRFGAPLKHLRL